MALYKKVMQNDGVITNYHRILYLTHTVNHHTSVAVLSYTDDSARENEKDGVLTQPYQKAVTYETDYDETMTPEKAYEYLKTLPQFEGAIDV